MKCYNFDIVCQEIPNEITLAINISGCPNRCKGCHSTWLWKDEGVELTDNFIKLLAERYSGDITCLCFMGGDQNPQQINSFASFIKANIPDLKVGWYSGLEELAPQIQIKNFDYIKLGPYIAERGGLRAPNTNQKFFQVDENLELKEIKFAPKNSF